jgi:hypothetical protein
MLALASRDLRKLPTPNCSVAHGIWSGPYCSQRCFTYRQSSAVGLVDDEVDDAREVQSSSVAHRNSSSVVFRLTLGMVCTDWVRALLRYGSG